MTVLADNIVQTFAAEHFVAMSSWSEHVLTANVGKKTLVLAALLRQCH